MTKSKLIWQSALLLVVAVAVSYCGGGGGGSPVVPPVVLPPPWTTKIPSPTLREYAASAVLDGKLYVVGGQLTGVGAPGPATDMLEIYDPASGIWVTGTSMPTARMGLVVVVANSKLYAIGGRRDATSATAVATVEQYDPGTQLWTVKNPMPVARYFGAGTALPVGLDTHVVVAGGEDASGARIKTVEEYNPITNQWIARNFLSIERSRLSISEAGGRLYAVGGYAGNVPVWVNSVEEYNPATGSWAVRAPMPTARGHLAVAVVNGQILVAGGENASPSLNLLESYDPVTNVWATKTPSPTAFTRGSAGTINGKLYVTGSALALEYNPANETK